MKNTLKTMKNTLISMKNRFLSGIILTGLMIFSGTVFTSCHHKDNTPADPKARRAQLIKQIDSLKRELVRLEKQMRDTSEADIPYIDTDTVQPQNFVKYIDLQGTVKTDGNIMVVPEFQGEVVKVYKKVGDPVRKGEVIMRIDDEILRNQIDEVRTQYRLALTAYQRQKRLWDQKIGSEMAYLQARAKKDGLYKKLRTLKSQLRKAKVTAPISGTLDDIMVKEGEMAAPGRPVARIVNLDKIYAEADVSEKYLTKVRKETPVHIRFPEIGKEMDGKVGYTGNFIHPNNRTFKTRVYLDNSDKLLKPNLTAHLQILELEKDSAVVLPLDLIMEDRAGNNYVFVLEPTDKPDIYTVKKRVIRVGPSYNGRAMIVDGLNPGDLLARLGARGLTEGDRVRIRKPQSDRL